MKRTLALALTAVATTAALSVPVAAEAGGGLASGSLSGADFMKLVQDANDEG